jgi:NAD(P)-dependent dehydrogenase (short-subunit alcohol dehydrogenase family)
VSPIKTSFGFRTTAAEVVAGVDLTGKRAIVTGASSGIGIETARALAGAGATVTLAVRDLAAGARAATDIAATAGRDEVDVAELDLTSPASVAAFAAAWRGSLDILVNNAGVMMSPEQRTSQGWELQFATNHLGHFALTRGLHDALAASGAARVVVVSSSGHLFSLSSSTTCTSASARTTRCSPTPSRRPPPSSLPSARARAGRKTG